MMEKEAKTIIKLIIKYGKELKGDNIFHKRKKLIIKN